MQRSVSSQIQKDTMALRIQYSLGNPTGLKIPVS